MPTEAVPQLSSWGNPEASELWKKGQEQPLPCLWWLSDTPQQLYLCNQLFLLQSEWSSLCSEDLWSIKLATFLDRLKTLCFHIYVFLDVFFCHTEKCMTDGRKSHWTKWTCGSNSKTAVLCFLSYCPEACIFLACLDASVPHCWSLQVLLWKGVWHLDQWMSRSSKSTTKLPRSFSVALMLACFSPVRSS